MVQSILDNRVIAEKRLIGVTNKYFTNSDEFSIYHKIFQDWLAEGIIEEAVDGSSGHAHYLPHRPVYKPQSLTTPLRPVFNASCKTNRSPSLNESLEKGPNLMELIPSVLLRFLEKKIGVLADIRKAFQMIAMEGADRDFLRFLWWESDRKTVKVFRHTRVVFGLNSSPFLLAAVIQHHLKHTEGPEWIVEKLAKSLYVDNCVTSVDTTEEYKEFKDQSIRIMASAKMELRQWEHSLGKKSEICAAQESSAGLGMKWDKVQDTLSFEIPDVDNVEVLTKRKILSIVQKIFDIIGVLCPILLQPNLILQDTWDLKVAWDEALPVEVILRFGKWTAELQSLRQLAISSRSKWQVHTFCDASQDAYAACAFLRTEDHEKVSVELLQAKSRVAPLQKGKRPTIPRLEFLGCTIAAHLTKAVKEALSVSKRSVHILLE